MGTVRDKLESYTLASGTIYYLTSAQVFGNASGTGGAAGTTTVPDVDIVYQRITTPSIQVYFLRKNTATPTTPAVGEFGFDNATQRLYVNVGVALPTGANVGFNLDACTNSVNGLLYNRVLAKGTLWPAATAVQEGHGIAFDDMASNSMVMNSECIGNAGLGVSLNRGRRNRVFNTRLYDNAKGPIGGTGLGHRIWGNYAKGSGYTLSGGNKGVLSIVPPVYLFKDEPTVCGGWGHLQYTGPETDVFLMIGNPDFSAPAPRFESSSIDPGVGRVHGYGSGAGEGGFVLARGLRPIASGHRVVVGPTFTGY
jgi:hypothetical protein